MTGVATMERLRLLSLGWCVGPARKPSRPRYLSYVLTNWLEPGEKPKPPARPVSREALTAIADPPSRSERRTGRGVGDLAPSLSIVRA